MGFLPPVIPYALDWTAQQLWWNTKAPAAQQHQASQQQSVVQQQQHAQQVIQRHQAQQQSIQYRQTLQQFEQGIPQSLPMTSQLPQMFPADLGPQVQAFVAGPATTFALKTPLKWATSYLGQNPIVFPADATGQLHLWNAQHQIQTVANRSMQGYQWAPAIKLAAGSTLIAADLAATTIEHWHTPHTPQNVNTFFTDISIDYFTKAGSAVIGTVVAEGLVAMGVVAVGATTAPLLVTAAATVAVGMAIQPVVRFYVAPVVQAVTGAPATAVVHTPATPPPITTTTSVQSHVHMQTIGGVQQNTVMSYNKTINGTSVAQYSHSPAPSIHQTRAGHVPLAVPQATASSAMAPAASFAVPQVGGILFNASAGIGPNLGEIVGAYWDDDRESLVLITREDESGAQSKLTMPSADTDHLRVAMRAALIGEPIGVSIDPPAEYRHGALSAAPPPDGTPMIVSYLGQSEDTLLGAVLFESDRLLKILDKGVDNETGEPRTTSVPGYRSLLDMIDPDTMLSRNVWHRFWFVIDEVVLDHDPDTGALGFGDVRLKVLSETELAGKAAGASRDPAADTFAGHLTDHYDEYAAEYPILAQLKEIAKLTALANYLARTKLDLGLDLHGLLDTPPEFISTKRTTPGITSAGRTTGTSTVRSFGGVDLRCEPTVAKDTGDARRRRNRLVANRPANASRWSIQDGDSTLVAVEHRWRDGDRSFSHEVQDHVPKALGKGCVHPLQRTYRSSAGGEGVFGRGWAGWIPYSLTVIAPSGKDEAVLSEKEKRDHEERSSVLILNDHVQGTSAIYRRSDESRKGAAAVVYVRVVYQTPTESGGLSYAVEASDRIVQSSDGLVLSRHEQTLHFSSDGRLDKVVPARGYTSTYRWDQHRLAGFSCECGSDYRLTYDSEHKERISEVDCGDGEVLHYGYDAWGRLLAFESTSGRAEYYLYDRDDRLIEIRDARGQLVRRNLYRPDGTWIDTGAGTTRSVVSDDGDTEIRLATRNGVPVRAECSDGGSVTFQEAPGGVVRMAVPDAAEGSATVLEFGPLGLLTGIEGPGADRMQLAYDDRGQVQRVTDETGQSGTITRDAKNRPVEIAGDDGRGFSFEYDGQGRLAEVTGPGGARSTFTSSRLGLLRAQGPGGSLRVKPRRKTMAFRTTSRTGAWQEQVLDRAGRLVSTRSRGARAVKRVYSADGRLERLETEAGSLGLEFDPDGLTLTVRF